MFAITLNSSMKLSYVTENFLALLQMTFLPVIFILFLSVLTKKSTGIHPIGMMLCLIILAAHGFATTQTFIISNNISNQVCMNELIF